MDVPPVNATTITACMQQVLLRGAGGRKAKSSELAGRMAKFWNERFSKPIYPDKLKAVGQSRITQVVSENIVKDCLTNATTHFESRCKRLCTLLGLGRQEAATSVRHAFHGQWDQVDKRVRESLLCCIPHNIKENVWYDMKKRPSEYVRATWEREKALYGWRKGGLGLMHWRQSCQHSARTNNLEEFLSYLAAKKLFNESEAENLYTRQVVKLESHTFFCNKVQ